MTSQSKYKKCEMCKHTKPISHFYSQKSIKFNPTKSCYSCRLKNSARYIAREQNMLTNIIYFIKMEGIQRTHLYRLYIQQQKKCYICHRKVNIPLIYINKFNIDKNFTCNMFLSCSICNTLREDESVQDFSRMIRDTNYPFNQVSIKLYKRKKKINVDRPFVYEICG